MPAAHHATNLDCQHRLGPYANPEPKLCHTCGRKHDRTCFGKHSGNGDGLQTQCRECENRKSKALRRRNPINYLYKTAKSRAKRKGMSFTISKKDIIIPDICPVLGIPLRFADNSNGMWENGSPTIDRIDNTRGYEPGNIQVISHRANTLKSNATAEELELVIAYIKRWH